MADINLLQSTTSSPALMVTKIKRVIARVLMIVLLVIVAGYGYLYFDLYQTNKNLTTTETAIAKAQSEALSNKDRSELITRQGQLKELDTLVKQHLYWSYLLPELARVTLKSAKYTAIDAGEEGKLNLTVSLPSYTDLEKFMQIFDLPAYNQQFSNVKIMSIGKTQQDAQVEISVRLELTFNPAYIKDRL